MRRLGWATSVALGFVASSGCGGLLAEDASRQDAGAPGQSETHPDGGLRDAGSETGARDGGPVDERGPPPVPVCTGDLSMCLAPDAGLTWTGAAVIQCQPVQYQGPWTLVLERQIGSAFTRVQTQVVQEPGFGAAFYDTKAPPIVVTYRVCVVESDGSGVCGSPFNAQGPPNCGCEPTNCRLQTACNTTIEDWCGGTLRCGDCTNGTLCNPDNNTCCKTGDTTDGWGGCVCAPPPGEICRHGSWDVTSCSCVTEP